MHVTLVQPRLGTSGVRGSFPPLAMGILARHTPREIQLRFIDEGVEEIPHNLATDLVAMSVTTLTARRAYDCAALFRKRGIPVVMGGFHPTLIPDEAILYADAIVKGVGELIWPKVLADAEKKKLKRVYNGTNDGPLLNLTPDRTIYKGKKYAPIVPVQFGRGCPFTCNFCSVHSFYGTTVKHRSVDEVLEEIAALKKELLLKNKLLFFVDDNIHAYGKASLDLFRGLSRLRVRWIGQASVNAARDPDTVKLLKESGCISLIIGFESMDKECLTQMHKKINYQHDYKEAVHLLQKHRIMIAGSFVFGYDNDKASTIENALAFSLRKNFAHAYFNPLVPTPGTGLYNRLLAEKRFIDSAWWLSDSFQYGHFPFTTKGASNQELEDACIAARLQFDSILSIVKRGICSRANWFPLRNFFFFWLANLIYRKEYQRKYGKRIFEEQYEK